MLENVGRAIQNSHVGLRKSCLEALRTSTWPCLPHRAAQRSPRGAQEAQTPPREALWNCKTRACNASRPPTQRFGYLFLRKTQPNHCFTKVALVKARVLRVQIAPRCSFASLASLLPCLGSPSSPRSSFFAPSASLFLRFALPRPFLPRFAPRSSLASALARSAKRLDHQTMLCTKLVQTCSPVSRTPCPTQLCD